MPHVRSRLLRAWILFGCLLFTPLTAGPEDSGPDRFLKVKAWILDFTIIETFSGSLAAYGASATKTVQRSANGHARLVPDSPSFDKTGAVWRGVTSGTGKALEVAKSSGPVGSVTDTLRASGAGEAEAALDLRTENGTYSLGAALGGIQGKLETVIAGSGMEQRTSSDTVVSLCIKPEGDDATFKLPASGMVITGNFGANLMDADAAVYGTKLHVTYSWTLRPAGMDEPEVELSLDQPDWLPELDNSVTATLTWKGKVQPSAIRWELTDVSQEKGSSLNSLTKDTDPDLIFDEGYAQQGYLKDGDTIIHRDVVPNKTETIRLRSRDWAAWGKLRCQLTIGGQKIDAKVASGSTALVIPRDSNDNHIADKWEEDERVRSTDAVSDEDPLPALGQSDGDMVSLFEEYRGFMVLSGGQPNHVRLRPQDKEVFVLDEAGLFDPGLWKSVTGLTAYRLDGMLTAARTPNVSGFYGSWTNKENRVINPNSGFGTAGKAFAMQLVTWQGLTPPPLNTRYGPLSEGMAEVGQTLCDGTIESADFSLVFLGRIEKAVNSWGDYLQWAKGDPATLVGQAVKRAGLTPAQVDAGIQAMKDPGVRQRLIQRFVTRTVIHELGHSCGVDHHEPETEGAGDCPTRYDWDGEIFRYAALESIEPGATPMLGWRKELCSLCKGNVRLK